MEFGIHRMEDHAIAGLPGFLAQLCVPLAGAFGPGAVQLEAGL